MVVFNVCRRDPQINMYNVWYYLKYAKEIQRKLSIIDGDIYYVQKKTKEHFLLSMVILDICEADPKRIKV